jgi:hypothetical protein
MDPTDRAKAAQQFAIETQQVVCLVQALIYQVLTRGRPVSRHKVDEDGYESNAIYERLVAQVRGNRAANQPWTANDNELLLRAATEWAAQQQEILL